VKYVTIDVGKYKDLKKRTKVNAVPMIQVYRNGEVETDRDLSYAGYYYGVGDGLEERLTTLSKKAVGQEQ
jgi:hypothetical protein